MSNKEKKWKCLAPVDLIAAPSEQMLSHKLSITTRDFLNILYWFEERRNATDNGGKVFFISQAALLL